jgi:Na+:H+ antiporter
VIRSTVPTPATVEFLIWLLIAASVIAVIAIRLRIPYTVALVMGGLVLGALPFPIVQSIYQSSQRPNWLSPDIILIFFLPTLLFEGSLKINLGQLLKDLFPIAALATAGVIVAACVTGYIVAWLIGMPLLVALLFGAIISATDPIAVLSIAKQMTVSKRLTLLLEGESLFNDGTAVVLFQILFAAAVAGHFSIASGVLSFTESVAIGAAVGFALGYVASKVTGKIDDAQVEITLTTIVAYSSYLLANHFHASGVIATVMAGLIVGNWGTQGMSPRTRVALWSFWEYASFAMNSVLFLLIGMEVRVATLVHEWRAVGLAIGAVLLGRVLAVYGVTSLTDLVSRKIGLRWKHLLTWGGLHGALSLALALSLTSKVPYREQILTFTFAVVAFSMIAQGLSIKWLIRKLGLSTAKEDEQDRIRAQQIAISAARSELQQMFNNHVVSAPVYDRLRKEFDDRLGELSEQVSAIYSRDFSRAESELDTARVRLVAAERSSLEDAIREGLILQQTGAQTADAMDSQLDQLIKKALKKEE